MEPRIRKSITDQLVRRYHLHGAVGQVRFDPRVVLATGGEDGGRAGRALVASQDARHTQGRHPRARLPVHAALQSLERHTAKLPTVFFSLWTRRMLN